MRIIRVKDYNEMSELAANIISSRVILKPDSVLGLATGSTPLGVYKELIRLNKTTVLSFSKAISFNLDEYYPINKDNVQSYNYYMKDNFFDHIDIKDENIHIPNGESKDIRSECEDYEEKINMAKGIDIQLLGIGNNGHIGFNEPSDFFESRTNHVDLTDETLKANARFFEDRKIMPTKAITMGIGTIMKSKQIILLASGENKADIIQEMIYGKITPHIPASILQLHPDVIVIVDEIAGFKIRFDDKNA